MTYAIAIVNKNLVNRTVPFENELVPLNGHIDTITASADYISYTAVNCCQLARGLQRYIIRHGTHGAEKLIKKLKIIYTHQYYAFLKL